MYLLYSALLAAGLLVSLPYWMFAKRRHGKYREGLGERLGKVPARLQRAIRRRPSGCTRFRSARCWPSASWWQSCAGAFRNIGLWFRPPRATGQKLARKHFGEDSVFYFPLDFAFAIRPYLSALQPRLIVLAETEFWPNFLRLAHASGARVAVVNARISDRSWPGYRRFRRILKRVLQEHRPVSGANRGGRLPPARHWRAGRSRAGKRQSEI